MGPADPGAASLPSGEQDGPPSHQSARVLGLRSGSHTHPPRGVTLKHANIRDQPTGEPTVSGLGFGGRVWGAK